MKKVSFSVGSDVFEVVRFTDVPPTAQHEKILQGFLNNPTGIDVTNNKDVAVGWKFINNKFIKGDSAESSLTFAEQTGLERYQDYSYFALLSNNEVFTFIVLKDTDEKHDMYKAAFETGVTIVVEEV